MSKFQIIFLGIFVLFIIAGVIGFATYRGSSYNTQLPSITVWGTFPSTVFSQHIGRINSALSQSITVSYVEKSPSSFSSDFISALARGTGPDAILVSAEYLMPHMDKVTQIPYSAFSQRNFRDTYIQQAEMYLTNSGILAVPFTVDPLIMYWNRDQFFSTGLATYPKYWDEFADINTKLTIKDQNGNIRRSAVALGDFSNITNAREVLGTLMLQTGNPVTRLDSNGSIVSSLKLASPYDISPAVSFFSQAVDPSNKNYSWNRGLPIDKTSFLAGTLATYFGFASELADIRTKNPNLNFDAAPFPQTRTGGLKSTYGRIYGFSIVRSARDPNATYQIISILTSPQYLSDLSGSMYLPSVRRDLIAGGSDDPYISVFNENALISKSWFDADPAQSRQLFGNMIGAITSGRRTVYQAIQDASDQYDIILRQAVR